MKTEYIEELENILAFEARVFSDIENRLTEQNRYEILFKPCVDILFQKYDFLSKYLFKERYNPVCFMECLEISERLGIQYGFCDAIGQMFIKNEIGDFENEICAFLLGYHFSGWLVSVEINIGMRDWQGQKICTIRALNEIIRNENVSISPSKVISICGILTSKRANYLYQFIKNNYSCE